MSSMIGSSISVSMLCSLRVVVGVLSRRRARSSECFLRSANRLAERGHRLGLLEQRGRAMFC